MRINLSFFLVLSSCSLFAQYKPTHFEEHKQLQESSYSEARKLGSDELAKMNKYDVTFYFIDINATDQNAGISGSTTINGKVKNEVLTDFVFELNSGISIDSVIINNIKAEFTRSGHFTTATMSNPIPANGEFSAKIYYNRPSSLSTIGVYNKSVGSWGKRVTYTLSESWHAYNWFPCKQDLMDKADSVSVYVTIPQGLKVGSNGILKKITPVGDKNRYEWESKYAIDYYLISIAVADYTEYNTYAKPKALNGDSILIQNYLYNNYSGLPSQKVGMDVTAEQIELFSDLFSIYPFWKEKYGHCYVPLGGAMEHQTMTYTGGHDFDLIAHELGHQWFGDNVTCATWQDIFINEGFASYCEYLALEYLTSKSDAKSCLVDAQGWAKTAPNGSVFIPLDEVSNEDRIFSYPLTYRKGLCLVHMIREEINNDALFFSILQDFQTDYADSVATGADLRDFLTEKSGIDFTAFFNEWYYGAGYPTYKLKYYKTGEYLGLEILQTTSAAEPSFFSNEVTIKIFYQGGDTVVRVKPLSADHTHLVDFKREVKSVIFDPENAILKGTSTIINNAFEMIEESQVKCYPNPTIDVFTIETIENSYVEIIDMQGKVVYAAQNQVGKLNVDTRGWSQGVYLVKVIFDGQYLVENIQKL